MKDVSQETNVRVDSYTRFCLTVIAILMTVLIIGLWAEVPGPVSQAGAQERYQPRSTIDITELLAVQRETNVKLGRLIGLFKNGKAKVQVVSGAVASTTVRAPTTGGKADVSATEKVPTIRIHPD